MSRIKIPVKHIQPISTVLVRMQSGEEYFWCDTSKNHDDLQIEWINGKPNFITYTKVKKSNPELKEGL